MRRFIAASAAFALLTGPVFAQDLPTPRELIAQVDDSDLADEITEQQIIQKDIDDNSKSMGAAIGLSLIPGGGFGLIYSGKKAQSVVPFLLSAAGYGIAAAYFVGAFDESSTDVCLHERDGRVPIGECSISNTPGANQANDPRSENGMTPYFGTESDYSTVKRGEDFDGKDTAILIAAGTYALTTIIGAAWAGSVVYDINEQARKDAESTVMAPKPMIGFDGERGYVGIGLDF